YSATSGSNWGTTYAPVAVTKNLAFAPFWHPFVCEFVKALRRRGAPGLLTLETQRLREVDTLYTNGKKFDLGTLFERQYKPTLHVDKPYPVEDVDFSYTGAYSLYNWELFFHTPMLIATRLGSNQRFEEAQRWFHYIFDPTVDSGQVWKVSPFTTA